MKHLILYENYPSGSVNDPRAPWNQKDMDIVPQVDPKSSEYKAVTYGPKKNPELAILQKNGTEDYYTFIFSYLDKKDLYQYGEVGKTYSGSGEDGLPDYDYEYDDFEVTLDVIERYVNDNVGNLQVGSGIEDYESGIDLVKIDSDLLREVIKDFDIDPSNLNIPTMEGWVEVK